MNALTDQQLLREYAEHRAKAAFGELVQRHVDLVYSAALRMVRDAHLAEDVTQGVFLALARSAGQLTGRPVLSGWLHRTTQNLAANTVRSDVRRRAREQEAAVMNELLSTESDPAWEEITPHLDAVLGELSEPDRDALLLRYFERKSAREMAQTLGTTEEAAQKRVNRAIERLRELLGKRGVTAGAGGLAVLLSAHAVHAAPIGLALSITTSAALGGTAAGALTASAAAKAIGMTALQKALIATTLVAAIGVGTFQARQTSRLRAQVKALQQQPAPPPAPTQAAVLASLQTRLPALEAQNAELTNALAQSNADKARLQMEREGARRSAALYRQLVEQANSKDSNPTNEYPSRREVWAGFGRMGRIGALSKEDDSKLTPEEKSALEAAKTKALQDLPTLVQAAKHYEAEPAGADPKEDDTADHMVCLLYGALNLDQEQFREVYSLIQKSLEDAKQKGYSPTNAPAEKAAFVKQAIEQFKSDVQPIMTPEQSRILVEVLKQVHIEPGNMSFNFSF